MPPSPERGSVGLKHVAALVAAGSLLLGVTRGCDDEAPTDQLLSHQQVMEVCADSSLDIEFRGSEARQSYGTLTARGFDGESIGSVLHKYYPGTPKDAALESLRQANPDLAIIDETSDLPGGTALRLNISSFDTALLPKGTSLREHGESLGFDEASMACINGLKPGATYDNDVSILLPRQVSTQEAPLTPVVVSSGDTYYAIAQAHGVALETITPEQLNAHNLVPAERLQPGDIVYIKQPNATAEIVEPNQEIRDFVERYGAYAKEVEATYGVPYQVVLAQAILESGYGKSELAVNANNFFGMKANDEWDGPVYEKQTQEVVSEADLQRYQDVMVGQTKREDGSYNITITAAFKAFDSEEDGFMGYGGYLKDRGDGTFYADAFETNDAYEFVNRLVDENGPRYATDPDYARKIHALIDRINSVDSQVTPSAQEQSAAESTDAQAIYESYPENQRYMNPGENCLDPSFSQFELYEQSREHIDAVQPTKDKFIQFQKNIIDAREQAQAANPRAYDHPDLGTPESIKDDVDYFVLHFTAIPGEKADGIDAERFATSMKNGNRGALVQYYINYDAANNKSQTYHLTDNFTYQVPGYDERIFGVEVAGCNQAKLRPVQIEHALYLAANFLIVNGYVAQDQSVTQVVNAVIRGHRELNPDGHSDWPGISMDQFREKLVTLFSDELGYTR